MSDYRDTIKNAIENGIILDSCGYDERQKVWGRYIDLCGMDVKDAIPLGPEDCGGGGDKSGKTKNTVTFLMVENGRGDYTLNLSVEQASTSEYKASFVMDGVTKLVTVPAGSTIFDTNLTGYDPQKPYSIISDITILSESTTYNYVAKNTVKTGVFVLTINNDGTISKENVKYGTVYELPTAVERPGYDFIWKDEAGVVITGNTITMPEKDTVVNGVYVIKNYNLTYNIIETNYENGEVVSSITTDELTLNYGANILSSVSGLTPEKEGHNPSGWKYSDGTNVLSGDTLLDNTVINFVYELNSYNLTYISDGEIFANEVYYFMQEITPLSGTPEKEGYTFVSWDGVIPQVMPSHNVSVNAVFNINSYTLTYFVDGVEKYVDTYEYGAAISARSEETKEGYTFSGWGEIPATMPADNLDVYGTFTINSHLLSFRVDGNVYYSSITEYGTEIVAPAEPMQEGYEFSGWGEYPSTMPDNDVTVDGTFSILSYEIAYFVDGEPYNSEILEYNSVVVPIDEPTKEGNTFSGWDNVPNRMPANDVVVNGYFSANSYNLVYKVDGEIIEESKVVYGTEITPKENPTREGYTFSGWDNVPQTMPANDVEVNGYFTVNVHLLKYLLDGEVYYSANTEYGTAIVPLPDIVESGYTFSGWSQIPATMPDEDVTITGSLVVNQYTLTFNSEGVYYTAVTGDYGSVVPQIVEPSRSGYTFNGWNPSVPQTFPYENMTFDAMFLINTHTAQYKIDGQDYSSVTYEYGAQIVYPEVPERSGYTFTWNEDYITMPDNDIIINGYYTPVSDVNTIYYDAIYTSGETSVSDVSGMNSYEYENGVTVNKDFIIPGNPEYTWAEENLDEEEFDEWCLNHRYSMYFAAPVGTTYNFYNENGTELTNQVREVGLPFDINGIQYQGYSYVNSEVVTCCLAEDLNLTYGIKIAKTN